jgi:hypothetical protein
VQLFTRASLCVYHSVECGIQYKQKSLPKFDVEILLCVWNIYRYKFFPYDSQCLNSNFIALLCFRVNTFELKLFKWKANSSCSCIFLSLQTTCRCRSEIFMWYWDNIKAEFDESLNFRCDLCNALRFTISVSMTRRRPFWRGIRFWPEDRVLDTSQGNEMYAKCQHHRHSMIAALFLVFFAVVRSSDAARDSK